MLFEKRKKYIKKTGAKTTFHDVFDRTNER